MRRSLYSPELFHIKKVKKKGGGWGVWRRAHRSTLCNFWHLWKQNNPSFSSAPRTPCRMCHPGPSGHRPSLIAHLWRINKGLPTRLDCGLSCRRAWCSCQRMPSFPRHDALLGSKSAARCADPIVLLSHTSAMFDCTWWLSSSLLSVSSSSRQSP